MNFGQIGSASRREPVEREGARCGESAGHLVAGASYFACVLPKGHEGEHRRGGTCFAHGEYVGNQCPEWPKCITALERTAQSPVAPARSDTRTIQKVLQLHVDSSESMKDVYRRTANSDMENWQDGFTEGIKRAIEVADYRAASPVAPASEKEQQNGG